MAASTELDLQAAVITDYLSLADLLDGLPDSGWDTPSLCAGWRVREVVAHLTMPVRYSAEQFQAELHACEGDFTRLSNRVASRDAGLPTTTLVDNTRDDMLHRWTPPGGGQIGALTHVVIHSLDITVPLGVPDGRPTRPLVPSWRTSLAGARTPTSASTSADSAYARPTSTGALEQGHPSPVPPRTSPYSSAVATFHRPDPRERAATLR